MKRAMWLPALAAVALVAAIPAAADHQGPQGQQVGGGPQEGDQEFNPHLETLGFDPLGPPSSGLNAEIVFDSGSRVAYVGNLNFDADEFGTDPTIKVVDVTNPADPELIEAEPTLMNTIGSFDVKFAAHVLAASGHTGPGAGVTLFDRSNPRDIKFASHLDVDDIGSVIGSHNSYLWQDSATERVWLFSVGQFPGSMDLFDVTDPYRPVKWSEYDNAGAPMTGDDFGSFVHDTFTQVNPDGRVLNYQVGSIGLEILDVTDVVRGAPRDLTNADVIGFNYYSAGIPGAPPVTRPRFAHYVEPTASGNVTWVGDETSCDVPGIIHAFDTTALPAKPARKPLEEIGVIIESPDALMCQGLVNGGSENSQTQAYRWTGHNFDIVGDRYLVRGDYGRGVYVYDITNPADAGWIAKSRGLNQMVGAENKVEPGRDKELENYPFFWQAVFDPVQGLILASDINQGIYVLQLQPNP